jgi:hypothetical protein
MKNKDIGWYGWFRLYCWVHNETYFFECKNFDVMRHCKKCGRELIWKSVENVEGCIPIIEEMV